MKLSRRGFFKSTAVAATLPMVRIVASFTREGATISFEVPAGFAQGDRFKLVISGPKYPPVGEPLALWTPILVREKEFVPNKKGKGFVFFSLSASEVDLMVGKGEFGFTVEFHSSRGTFGPFAAGNLEVTKDHIMICGSGYPSPAYKRG